MKIKFLLPLIMGLAAVCPGQIFNGSGGVSCSGGTCTNNAAVFGAGASTIKVDSAITTDGSGNLTAVSFTTSGTNGLIKLTPWSCTTSADSLLRICSDSSGNLNFSYNGASLTQVAGLAGDIGGTQTSPQIIGLHLTAASTIGSTVSATSTGILDFSSATGVAAFKVPVGAGYAPVANGTLGYDSTKNSPVMGETEGGSSSTTTVTPARLLCNAAVSSSLDAGTIGTTETPFSTNCFFPANYWTVGKTALVHVAIQAVMPGTATTRLYKVRVEKSGPTDVNLYVGAVSNTPTTAVTRGYGGVFMLKCVSTGATGTISIFPMPGLNATPSSIQWINTVAQPVTFDTTAAQTLQVTVTMGAGTAGNTDTLEIMAAEELN